MYRTKLTFALKVASRSKHVSYRHVRGGALYSLVHEISGKNSVERDGDDLQMNSYSHDLNIISKDLRYLQIT